MPQFTIKSPSGQAVTVNAESQDAAFDQVLNGADGPDVSQSGSFGRGLTSMIPLGEQAYAGIAGQVQKEPYLQERNELDQEVAQDKTDNPEARLAGQATGVIAPALITGGASAPESLAAAAGEGALIGGGFGAGNAIDTLAKGGSGKDAAEEVALGAALGGAGGAAGNGVSSLIGKAAPALEDVADSKAVQAAHISPKDLANMSPEELSDLGQTLRKTDVVGGTTQEMFDKASKIHDMYGQQVGEIGDEHLSLDEPNTVIQPLMDKITDLEDLSDPEAVHATNIYKSAATTLNTLANRSPDGSIPWADLQRLKTQYGNFAFKNGNLVSPPHGDVYSAISAGMKNIADQNADNPELGEQYRTALKGYSKFYPVVEGLQKTLGQERAGQPSTHAFGMMGKLVSQLPGQSNPAVNMGTAAGLAALGHPLWGLGAATATLNNPAAMTQVASSAARAAANSSLGSVGGQLAGSMAPAIKPEQSSPTSVNLDHPAMAPWRQDFAKAASHATNPAEAAKSQAVTDFVLSQRDPSYNKTKADIAEQKGH